SASPKTGLCPRRPPKNKAGFDRRSLESLNCLCPEWEGWVEPGRDEFDLQPDPRILPMLGEINLAQWRCVAELVDNSIDSFISATRAGSPTDRPEVYVSLPTHDDERAKLAIRDNGPGMDAGTLERAV